jgi:L-iditol 2-dehydrogenase
MNQEMDLERLISHRFALSDGLEALRLAAHPQADSMKIVIQPDGFTSRTQEGSSE